MPKEKINGVAIYYEQSGSNGDPMVFVHGSWTDHHSWDTVVETFAKKFRVVVYDRRGHSESQRLPGQGWVSEDVEDLIALAEKLKLAPAHIIGNSFGSGIALKTAAKRPDIFKSLIIHEPPLFGLLADNPEAQPALQMVDEKMQFVHGLIGEGKMEEAAREFMEKIALGPGSWEMLPDKLKQTVTYNAITWYDEVQDPDNLQFDLSSVANFDKPVLLSSGSESPPLFPLVINKIKGSLPRAKQIVFNGAGHVPYLTHPEKYVEEVESFLSAKN